MGNVVRRGTTYVAPHDTERGLQRLEFLFDLRLLMQQHIYTR